MTDCFDPRHEAGCDVASRSRWEINPDRSSKLVERRPPLATDLAWSARVADTG